MAKTTAKPRRTARLTLMIAGVDYIVRPLASVELPPRTTRGWRLTRVDPKLGRVAHLVTAGSLAGRVCDCAAFKFGGQQCKHVAALRAVGLL